MSTTYEELISGISKGNPAAHDAVATETKAKDLAVRMCAADASLLADFGSPESLGRHLYAEGLALSSAMRNWPEEARAPEAADTDRRFLASMIVGTGSLTMADLEQGLTAGLDVAIAAVRRDVVATTAYRIWGNDAAARGEFRQVEFLEGYLSHHPALDAGVRCVARPLSDREMLDLCMRTKAQIAGESVPLPMSHPAPASVRPVAPAAARSAPIVHAAHNDADLDPRRTASVIFDEMDAQKRKVFGKDYKPGPRPQWAMRKAATTGGR